MEGSFVGVSAWCLRRSERKLNGAQSAPGRKKEVELGTRGAGQVERARVCTNDKPRQRQR
jgi:hypothetical protein